MIDEVVQAKRVFRSGECVDYLGLGRFGRETRVVKDGFALFMVALIKLLIQRYG